VISFDSIQHISFDKDGTLINIHMYWARVIDERAEALCDAWRLEPEVAEHLKRAMGLDTSHRRLLKTGPVGNKPRSFVIDAVCRRLSDFGVGATVKAVADVFVQIDHRIQSEGGYPVEPYPGVHEVFSKLKVRGYKISVVSSDHHNNILNNLQALRINGYVDAVVGGDDVKNGKPDPEGFIRACESVGEEPARSVYVGDSIDDMLMASRVCPGGGVGVLTGMSDREDLSRYTETILDGVHALEGFPSI
jgi:phosphoglycolate phosphatase-like HAD superfamily hydrolase